MNRKNVAEASLVTLLSTLLLFIAPVKAPDGSHFRWVNPAYMGPDMFYDGTIIGYLEETNWNFTIGWVNHDLYPLNVSAIRVYFDWGKNYTHTYGTPRQIDPGGTEIFQIYNMTPSISEAPELWTHHYRVYIERSNSTTPPYKKLTPIEVYESDDFAVLSSAHLECLRIFTKFGLITPSVDGGWPPVMTGFSNITETQVLYTRLYMKLMQGMQYYQVGLFDTARSHLQDADGYLTEALNAWNETGSAMEDADIAQKNAEANHYNALANSSLVNAYGWLLFGLGWVFIGLGVIVYGMRKPKVV